MKTQMNTRRRVTGKIERVEDLSDRDYQTMFALMQRYYLDLHQSDFERDLGEKQWVIAIRDSGNTICGFSTQVLWTVPNFPGTQILFSGDTVVDQSYRFSSLLAGLWGQLALSLMDQHAEQSLYWFLISKGYKTYRYLPLFFHEFYPRRDMETPKNICLLIECLGQWRFKERFCAPRGIVRATPDACKLRPEVAPVHLHRLQDPDVQFFVDANPNHAQGDELCCLAPLTRANFTSAGYRVIQSAANCTLE